jgi:hypothetical protein
MFAFALTIFAGAFLLFEVQPFIAKYILPWFGGGPSVWTTCMLFFQVLLLGGYAYAHLLSRWLKPRTQVCIHLCLLAAALACLPVTPSETWKPLGKENPTWRILALLTSTLGLPYFVLSSTSPLMQQWFSLTNPGRSPFRLYALSNVGSLLALLSYPFFFETRLTRKAQAVWWGWGLGAFVLCCAVCAWKMWKEGGRKQEQRPISEAKTSHAKGSTPDKRKNEEAAMESGGAGVSSRGLNRVLWLVLPACASILLLATTNKICQDVSVMPFLWVLPLALYLLSFMIAFDNPRWYARLLFVLALFGGLGWLCWAIPKDTHASLPVLIGGYAFCLFVGSMVCHGELYRLKPDPQHLTSFYLMIAAGGALGGVMVALVAPRIFRGFYELPLGFLLCAALSLVPWVRSLTGMPSAPEVPKDLRRSNVKYLVSGLGIALCSLAGVMWLQIHKFPIQPVEQVRNFYGVLSVFEVARDKPNTHHFVMQHGNTLHGLQFVNPAWAGWPTVYYDESSGVGRAILSLPQRGRRIGLVGLGIGTLAAYGRTNDYYRFYEINPNVMRLARKYFTYAPRGLAKADCVIGDARLSLEKEPPQNFDLLVLDAFNGDSIPVHLLTKEAFAVYDRHLNTNAIIAIHASNVFLDLEPLLLNLAHELGYQAAVIETRPRHDKWWVWPSTWILLCRNPEMLAAPGIREAVRPPEISHKQVRIWTDDFTSLFQVLRRRSERQ